MTRDQLYEFLVLARLLNFSAAAQQLYISQATLSRHIAALEKELGSQLFYRDTHFVSLTADGDIFRKDAYRLLRQFDTLLQHVHFPSLQLQGSCSVLCSSSALIPPLLELLADFQKRYQEIDFNLAILDEDSCQEQMDQYDISISTFSHDNPLHDSQLLTTYDAYLIIPRQWSFQRPHIAYFRELVHKRIFLPYMQQKGSPFKELWKKVDVATLHGATLCPVANIETALLNVSVGRGATILPAYFEQRTYNNSRIVHIDHADFKFEIKAYLNQNSTSDAAKLLFSQLNTQIPIAQA